MNAETKVAKAKKEPETLRIWNAVCRTDPKHTKRVNQRGGFTAIDAQYQIMMATEQFGPIGEGWGYVCGDFRIEGGMIVVPVTLWHGKRENTFGPILGCAEMLGQRPDRDAPKKAITDAITKGLSQLGFNADVFLGLFDDNKYVAEVTKEFSTGERDDKPKVKPAEKEGDVSPSALGASLKLLVHHIHGAGNMDDLTEVLDDPESANIIEQCKRRAPHWYETGDGMPEEFVPLATLINERKTALAAAEREAAYLRA